MGSFFLAFYKRLLQGANGLVYRPIYVSLLGSRMFDVRSVSVGEQLATRGVGEEGA